MPTEPKISIITALPVEFAAVKSLLDNGKQYWAPGEGAGREYWLGEMTAADGETHSVVLARAGMGNNPAAIRAIQLHQHFPAVNSIIMIEYGHSI
ncbi:MAG: 5'-methylthioadenosine/S-adenosylhomocysteine nucleosidase [Gammaproteobacteria bacterium]|nr:5'-methylthioadenosine/S-adenosylhomocysteine nucleosidase [Gammaproteobacteria bacterium]